MSKSDLPCALQYNHHEEMLKKTDFVIMPLQQCCEVFARRPSKFVKTLSSRFMMMRAINFSWLQFGFFHTYCWVVSHLTDTPFLPELSESGATEFVRPDHCWMWRERQEQLTDSLTKQSLMVFFISNLLCLLNCYQSFHSLVSN